MMMLMMTMHDEMMTLSVAAEESGFVNETLSTSCPAAAGTDPGKIALVAALAVN